MESRLNPSPVNIRMFRSGVRTTLRSLCELMTQDRAGTCFGVRKPQNSCELFSAGCLFALFSTECQVELPRKRKKFERKPMVTCVNELKRQARSERQEKRVVRENALRPPQNGLLVGQLVPVAHKVLAARADVFACASRVLDSVPIYCCSLCDEIHVGHTPHKIRSCDGTGSRASQEHTWKIGSIEHILPVVDSFHLYDRLGRAVSHDERLQVDRIPAILELCIQAGVDILEYPTRRRRFPVYSVVGKMIDFERRFPKDDSSEINVSGFWEDRRKAIKEKNLNFPCYNTPDCAARGMEAWEKMRIGTIKLMEKYSVQTCGFCPEVQVGPKGHKVRQCQAFKHQMRDGQHAWQEATMDDLVPPVYVWHVRNPLNGTPLVNDLRGYYGKLPAVVELFAQAGASVIDAYSGMVKEDVVVPSIEERTWVI